MHIGEVLKTYGEALQWGLSALVQAIRGMYKRMGQWLGLRPPDPTGTRVTDATITSSEARTIVWPADQWAEVREAERVQYQRPRKWMAPRNGGYMHDD